MTISKVSAHEARKSKYRYSTEGIANSEYTTIYELLNQLNLHIQKGLENVFKKKDKPKGNAIKVE